MNVPDDCFYTYVLQEVPSVGLPWSCYSTHLCAMIVCGVDENVAFSLLW